MEIVREPRLTPHVEDEAEVLELCVPPPHLVAHIALLLGAVDPETAESMPCEHISEGGENERDIETHPPPEELRRQVVGKLCLLAGLYETKRFDREDITGDDKKAGDGEVAPIEHQPHTVEGCESVVALKAEGIFEHVIFSWLMRP